MLNKFKTDYSPLYFLASLWAWGLSVSFFMYLMFLTKHENTPIPTFDSIMSVLQSSNLFMLLMIVLVYLLITIFAIIHIKLLITNIKNYIYFKQTQSFSKLKNSNDEVILMSIPLTLTMTMNVLFVVSTLSIPNLWSFIEYIFPFAIFWFLIIWFYALKIFWDYFTRLIVNWDFDFTKNNSLSQMISIFAFSMIWVWLAWPAGMSNNLFTSWFAMFFSILFIVISMLLTIVKLTIWIESIFKKWLNIQASPSLWIMIPILTLWWITFIRQEHWISTNFNFHTPEVVLFYISSVIISLQIIFWLLWYKVMKINKYFKTFISWSEKSPASYALICPWVAFVVFGFFFLHKGLVLNWIIEQFSVIYFVILFLLFILQIKTIIVMFKLNKKMIG